MDSEKNVHKEIDNIALYLKSARPTAVNLQFAVDLVTDQIKNKILTKKNKDFINDLQIKTQSRQQFVL